MGYTNHCGLLENTKRETYGDFGLVPRPKAPARVHLTELPEGVELRVGTTASVLVQTGGKNSGERSVAAPEALQ